MDDGLILIYEAGETRLIPKELIYVPPFERDDAIAAETEAAILADV